MSSKRKSLPTKISLPRSSDEGASEKLSDEEMPIDGREDTDIDSEEEADFNNREQFTGSSIPGFPGSSANLNLPEQYQKLMPAFFDAIRSMGYQTGASPIVVIPPPDQSYYRGNGQSSHRVSSGNDRRHPGEHKHNNNKHRRLSNGSSKEDPNNQPMNLKRSTNDQKHRNVVSFSNLFSIIIIE